jgi:hypothetical protein
LPWLDANGSPAVKSSAGEHASCTSSQDGLSVCDTHQLDGLRLVAIASLNPPCKLTKVGSKSKADQSGAFVQVRYGPKAVIYLSAEAPAASRTFTQLSVSHANLREPPRFAGKIDV